MTPHNNPFTPAEHRAEKTLNPSALALVWRERAKCRDHDPELFHPTLGERDKRDYAKAICQLCPVRAQCLEWALATDEQYAIYGGLTRAERLKLSAPTA